jgi:PAS domain S-box-containing protein
MPRSADDLTLTATRGASGGSGDEPLLEAGALQSAIFNSANFSSIATDAKGVIQIFNVGAERMLGYAAADVMNKITPADISDPEEVIARAAALSTELGTRITPGFEALVFKASRGIEDIYELTYIRKDGSRFPAVVSITALRDPGDAIIGYLLIGTDNTARHRAEAALANVQKLESLGVLAGGIAHDFNNILTAIMGNLSLLSPQITPGGDAEELVREAHSACDNAKGLANQLLTFAKGGAPVVKVIDLRLLLTETAVFATRGSNVRCVCDVGAAPLAVNVDKNQIAQVIQNLVINATQAMTHGGVITARADLVTLGSQEHAPQGAGRYVEVTVTDPGVGIAAEDLSKVFDPYFTTKAAGRGLGLAMCYSIMAKHGGSITVESKPGAGAVFTLRFPAADAAEITVDAKRGAGLRRRAKVLVMDDDAAVSRVLLRILERLGYQAEGVGDGAAALFAYRAAMEAGDPFDVVIMDLTIPGGMGGEEAIAKLKLLDPEAKAIVSSGYSNDPVISEYSAHGFGEALSKPYSVEEVSEALRRMLGPRGRPRS